MRWNDTGPVTTGFPKSPTSRVHGCVSCRVRSGRREPTMVPIDGDPRRPQHHCPRGETCRPPTRPSKEPHGRRPVLGPPRRDTGRSYIGRKTGCKGLSERRVHGTVLPVRGIGLRGPPRPTFPHRGRRNGCPSCPKGRTSPGPVSETSPRPRSAEPSSLPSGDTLEPGKRRDKTHGRGRGVCRGG